MAVLMRLFASLVPLVFATIAIAFAIKATISNDWASRNQYNASLNDNEWRGPEFVEHRSPFTICGFRQDNISQQETNPDTTFSYICESYSAFDTNKTSCEPESVTSNKTVAQYGDMRRCQQTHWAGNLSIASSTFIGIGFLLTLTTSAIAALAILLSSAPDADESSPVDPETSVTTGKTEATNHHHHETRRPSHRKRPHERYLSPTAPYLNVLLVFSFVFGAILAVFAQFYGVLAFVQSAPDNGAFASYGPFDTQIRVGNDTYLHAPWVQGKAISVYASVAWVFAGLAAITASIVWRMPTLARKSPV